MSNAKVCYQNVTKNNHLLPATSATRLLHCINSRIKQENFTLLLCNIFASILRTLNFNTTFYLLQECQLENQATTAPHRRTADF